MAPLPGAGSTRRRHPAEEVGSEPRLEAVSVAAGGDVQWVMEESGLCFY